MWNNKRGEDVKESIKELKDIIRIREKLIKDNKIIIKQSDGKEKEFICVYNNLLNIENYRLKFVLTLIKEGK